MARKQSQYQQDILAIMEVRGVDNLEAMRIYRQQNEDKE